MNCAEVCIHASNWYNYKTKCWGPLPENLSVIEGDLVKPEKWCPPNSHAIIVQQNNCRATRYHGLSQTIFTKYPWANIYEERRVNKVEGIPGNVMFRTKDNVTIANSLGQYYPNISKYPNDTYAMREQWFQKCLNSLVSHVVDKMDKEIPKVIAFPWNIASSLAGGNFDHYLAMIVEFAERIPNEKILIITL